MIRGSLYFSSTSMIIDLFRASLLFVALLSTSYVHFSILAIVSSFLSLNIMLIYKKVTSYEGLVQAIKHNKEMQAGDEEKEDYDFANDNSDEPIDCDRVNEKCDAMFDQVGLVSSIDIVSNLSLTSEDVEEDYLIDIISLPEQGVSLEEMMRHKLEIGFLDFFSDMNEMSGEEDSLIEIDISMGSIRQPAG